MPLKRYQTRVVQEVQLFLEELARQQAAASKHAALDAWIALKDRLALVGSYSERQNGVGKDLPSFYIKVPTGGGKTLLATQILGLIHQTILKSRNGTGLVLWVVPSDQIYKDTLKALRDRQHFYRESLEFALSRSIEVWEKHEIMRLTPGQLASNLNILLLMLPSTNRQDKESLKFFRDSGGNIVQHFPPEDQPEKHRELKQRVPNVEMIGEVRSDRLQAVGEGPAEAGLSRNSSTGRSFASTSSAGSVASRSPSDLSAARRASLSTTRTSPFSTHCSTSCRTT